MSNFTRINQVMVGDGANVGTTLAGITKGDLFLLNESGSIIATNAAAAALPKNATVQIAVGVEKDYAVLSGPISGRDVVGYEFQDTVAKSEQVTYLGYDGTTITGIASDPNTEYRLRVLIKDDARPNGQRPSLIDVNYKTGSSTTQKELAYSVACLFGQKDYGENYASNFVKLERISDGTFAALTNNATVTKGSTTVSSTAHGLLAGDVVRIGGTGATEAVYIVASATTNAFELDIAYKGESGTVLAANIGKLTAITNWGFKLTGLEQDSKVYRAANEPLDIYQWINFEAVFTEADDGASDQYSAKTSTTLANPGQGYWKQVAQSEEYAKANRGDQSKRLYFDQRLSSNTAVGTAYDSIVISYDKRIGSFALDDARTMLKTEIYIPDGSNQGLNSGNNFVHILNGFFSGVLGYTAVVFS